MTGGITFNHAPAEQVVMGEHRGIPIIVLSVKPTEDAAATCWEACCNLLDTLIESDAVDENLPLLIIDIATATIRHGYLTEAPNPKAA